MATPVATIMAAAMPPAAAVVVMVVPSLVPLRRARRRGPRLGRLAALDDLVELAAIEPDAAAGAAGVDPHSGALELDQLGSVAWAGRHAGEA